MNGEIKEYTLTACQQGLIAIPIAACLGGILVYALGILIHSPRRESVAKPARMVS